MRGFSISRNQKTDGFHQIHVVEETKKTKKQKKQKQDWGFLSYLDALVQTFQGVDVQALFAGLQTGNDLLALDLSGSNC